MLTFLFFSAFVIAAITLGGVVLIPLLAVVGLIWLITLPFRLLFAIVGGVFHLFFGLVANLVWLVLAPVRLLFGGIRSRTVA